MARTTYQTYLMHSTDGKAYSKLVDIKEFPDLGSAPPTVDITTLSDGQKMYLNDIKDPGSLEFNANYDKDDYATLKALEGKTEKFAIWFGASSTGGTLTPDGNDGKYEFEGELAVWIKGGSVSAAVDMGIAIAPSTEIKAATSA